VAATPGPPELTLAERLRALRVEHRSGRVTQQTLASVLGVSTPLISSWESGAAVPPAERLREYALAFANERIFTDAEPQLPQESDLTAGEERRRQDLIDELVRLRDRAIRPVDAPRPGTGALGGRFWYFPDGYPIRIVTTQSWPSLEDKIPYLDPWHPNYIASFRDMDRDATIELYGHIRAENPTADVRFLTADQVVEDDLTGHVVVLGQGDQMLTADHAEPHPHSEYRYTAMRYLFQRLDIPVGTWTPRDGDRDFDSVFVVTLDDDGNPHKYAETEKPVRVDTYSPRFLRDLSVPGRPRLTEHGFPVLEYDVALLARKQNQLNLSTTVTICSGVFSRGTYGAVRALTDATLRTRNEAFLADHFHGLSDFWLLFYVPVFRASSGLGTVTPDLERPFHRLRSSS